MHLLDRIDSWADRIPERVAHQSGDRVITYRALRDQSDRLAAWIDDHLGDDRTPIAVHGHKEPEMLVAFIAAVKSGRPYVPIDIAIPAQRVDRIVATACASLVLTPAKIAEVLAGSTPTERRLRRVQAGDPFYILFTSGSTGEPKGVVITLSNLEAFLGWLIAEQRFTEQGETFLNQAPFSFDLSVMDLYGSLATGGTLFSITKEHVANLKLLYTAFRESGVTTWVSTPSFAQMCLVERTFDHGMLPGVTRFLFCGETLAPETAAQLLDRFPEAQVWNTYGPTEATVATTSIQITRDILARYSPLPVGVPMPGVEITIRGEGGGILTGERGEIVIAGPNVSPGYLGRDDLTAAVFQSYATGTSYRTGDWGRISDGFVFFEGRMDGQVKVHGYRIELGDLEANLRALPHVADAVVLPLERNGKVDGLAAFVVLAGPREGTDFALSSALKTSLADRLPVYMLPRKFVFLEAFPMTPNGKADRRKLAESLG